MRLPGMKNHAPTKTVRRTAALRQRVGRLRWRMPKFYSRASLRARAAMTAQSMPDRLQATEHTGSSLRADAAKLLPRPQQCSDVQHDEQRNEVCWNEYERQLSHRRRRHRPAESGHEARVERPKADGDNQVQNAQEIPNREGSTNREAGAADQGDHDPRRGHSAADITQP